MPKLLTNRLSVVGKGRLKQTFSSGLMFALKGVSYLPEDRLNLLLEAAEEFCQKPDIYIRFRELSMRQEHISIWLQYLSDGVYACSLEDELSGQILPTLQNTNVTLAEIWNIYANIYAQQLLYLGSRIISKPENQFNQTTVRYFIANPDKVHGSDLINNIPPLLEKDYIYLNRCGEDQQTTWHRDTFLDSYFKALMSYQPQLSAQEIMTAFNVLPHQSVSA